MFGNPYQTNATIFTLKMSCYTSAKVVLKPLIYKALRGTPNERF